MSSSLPKVQTVKNILENIIINGKKIEKKELDKLLKLKFNSDSMFNLKERDFILEAIQILNTLGFEQGYTYLKSSENQRSREMIIRNSPVFDNSRKRNFLEITKDLRTVKVESYKQCPRCKQFHVDSFSKQVRSGDEGETTFNKCSDCGHQWKE